MPALTADDGGDVLTALKRAIAVEVDAMPVSSVRRHLARGDHSAAQVLGATTWRVARELGVDSATARRRLLGAVAAKRAIVESSIYRGGMRWWPAGYCAELWESPVA